MVHIVSSKNIKSRKKRILSGAMLIYGITLLVSIFLIVVSFCPGGYEAAGTVLLSIGCSGVAAAIMAIFLEISSVKNKKEQEEFFRYTYFNDLNQQLKKLFERLLWFDKTLGNVDISKDMDYYLSLDFISEAEMLDVYETITFKEADLRIQKLFEKYKEEKWNDNEITWEQINRVLQIIGRASVGVTYEIDRLKDDKFELIQRGIIDANDIEEIIRCVDGHTRMLLTGKMKSINSLRFPWKAYKKLHDICGFCDDFYVSWQSDRNILDVYVDSKM